MIVVIDYGLGNLKSVLHKLRRLGIEASVSTGPADLERADKLILPGVGHFAEGMRNLRELGYVEALERKVLAEGVSILGICLGMQLFTTDSEEGGCGGLGWLDARTRRFPAPAPGGRLKVPHMGWNTLEPSASSPLLEGVGEEDLFYFVHSYYVECGDAADVLARSTYGVGFHSVVARGSIYGTQFHPEKSHGAGMRILRNFAGLP